jgi:hypothetical protein
MTHLINKVSRLLTISDPSRIYNRYSEIELNFYRSKIKNYYDNFNELHFNQGDDDDTKGCKITATMMKDAGSIDPSYTEEFLKKPPFMFYTLENGLSIIRIIGINKDYNGKMFAKTVSAHSAMTFNNLIIEEMEFDHLIPIKNWSQEHLDQIDFDVLKYSNVFIEKLGFFNMLH